MVLENFAALPLTQQSRRGLSREEKKVIILDILRGTLEPYAIQELEKKASKRGVGIQIPFPLYLIPVLQTVKDIVLELEADGDITADKIGVTTFYWSFPSDACEKVSRACINHFLTSRPKENERSAKKLSKT